MYLLVKPFAYIGGLHLPVSLTLHVMGAQTARFSRLSYRGVTLGDGAGEMGYRHIAPDNPRNRVPRGTGNIKVKI